MSAAVAVIAFLLDLSDGTELDFLRLWNDGEFDKCRKDWPEAPEAVYIGADPMHPLTDMIGDPHPEPLSPELFGNIKYEKFCKLRDEMNPPASLGATYYPKYSEREAFELAINN